MNKPEILSPAASFETLNAAVQAGADAVYFGGHTLNARRNATNFEDEDIAEAIKYCHIRGVKAYITLNTLVFDREFKSAFSFAQLCAGAGADAFIVQDIGLAVALKRAAPKIRLHASTQMSIHNLQGVQAAAELGFERAVLARELSKEEIAEIAEKSPIELEVFVHGALCMCISGGCYMSSVFGGRSGNRGLCAQPCRLPFCANGGTGYDLSLKDLSLVQVINELSQMGIASLKIEGRMKRPEYIAAATDICARTAGGEDIDGQQLENLQSVFSRSGFTQGYYNASLGREMFGHRNYDDVVAAQGVLKGYEALYKDERSRIEVAFEFSLKEGCKAALKAIDTDGNRAYAEGTVPEKARTKGIDEQVVTDKLRKTGGTPFFAGEIKTDITPSLSIPVSEINSLRRQVLETITEKRAIPKQIEFNTEIIDALKINTAKQVQDSVKLHMSLHRMDMLTPAVQQAAEIVFLPVQEIIKNQSKAESLRSDGLQLGVLLPRAVFGNAAKNKLQEDLDILKSIGICDALCGNIGVLKMAKDAGLVVHGDFGLNITNRFAFEQAVNFGVRSCVLSFEATLEQIKGLQGQNGGLSGIIAYGRLPLMLTRNCPVKNGASCKKNTSGRFVCKIKDKIGETLPVICEEQACEILNTRPLWMCDRKSDVRNSGVGFVSFYFTVESPEEIDGIIEAWQNGQPSGQSFTRGLYYRGVE
jgi:putative protease